MGNAESSEPEHKTVFYRVEDEEGEKISRKREFTEGTVTVRLTWIPNRRSLTEVVGVSRTTRPPVTAAPDSWELAMTPEQLCSPWSLLRAQCVSRGYDSAICQKINFQIMNTLEKFDFNTRLPVYSTIFVGCPTDDYHMSLRLEDLGYVEINALEAEE